MPNQHTGFLFSAEFEGILMKQPCTSHRHDSTPHHSLQLPSRAQEPPLKNRLSFVLYKVFWVHTPHNASFFVGNGCAILWCQEERGQYCTLQLNSRATKPLKVCCVCFWKQKKNGPFSPIRVEMVLPFLT